MKGIDCKAKLFYTWLLLATLMIGSISGCAGMTGQEAQNVSAQGEEKEIELLDPVGVATNYDVVGYRDIYNSSVNACIVSPAVTEFDYTTDDHFSNYG